MRRLSRRELLKGAAGAGLGVALGALGLGAVLENLGQDGGQAAAGRGTLPFYARPARFALPVQGDRRCGDCHTEAEPSRPAYCHTEHRGDYVKCRLCPKGCLISEGRRGDCQTRENRGGTLYTMTYGNPCAVNVDPIEKKPFFHFLPGSRAFSLATAGCNLHCLYCQNWDISQIPPEKSSFGRLMPAEVVDAAVQTASPVIAFTYTEPTVFFEYACDTAGLARSAGLRSAVISAGYINPEPLHELCALVDAVKIDLKGINEDFYRQVCSATLEPVLNTIRTVARSGVHLEIVNLVVPTLNDDLEDMRSLARWVRDEVGPDVPLHFSRFQPAYRLLDLPMTPLETLRQAREIAMEEGLRYVYIGNVPGDPGSHTYCPRCGQAIICRSQFAVTEMHMQDGMCAYCGEEIAGVWA